MLYKEKINRITTNGCSTGNCYLIKKVLLQQSSVACFALNTLTQCKQVMITT